MTNDPSRLIFSKNHHSVLSKENRKNLIRRYIHFIAFEKVVYLLEIRYTHTYIPYGPEKVCLKAAGPLMKFIC